MKARLIGQLFPLQSHLEKKLANNRKFELIEYVRTPSAHTFYSAPYAAVCTIRKKKTLHFDKVFK